MTSGLLEDAFEMTLDNAQRIRNVPGRRRTSGTASAWSISRVMAHRQELFHRKTLRGSRDMLRYRRRVMESRAADRTRRLNLLETANIKSASVAIPP